MMRPRVSRPTGTCTALLAHDTYQTLYRYQMCIQHRIPFPTCYSNLQSLESHLFPTTSENLSVLPSLSYHLELPHFIPLPFSKPSIGIPAERQTGRGVYHDGGACVDDALSPDQPISGVHSDGPQGILSQMLGHLQNQPHIVVLHLQGCHDRGQLAIEVHVHDGTNDL